VSAPLRFAAQGEGGLLVELGEGIDPAVNARVHALARALREAVPAGVQEVVPSYRSLLVVFDPLRLGRAALEAEVTRAARGLEGAPPPAARLVTVPVCYGGEHGPDLPDVAKHAGLSEEEVVRLHAGATYLVYLVGFTPGFPYLGGLPPRLATPRLATPRRTLPAGSVAIGGAQAGIYPVESPGGWRLVGRTPLRLFDAASEAPFLLAPGDRVRFEAIAPAAFARVAADVAAGRHRAEASPLAGEVPP
jgi:KipI family sensor histidine kinase inhibitor